MKVHLSEELSRLLAWSAAASGRRLDEEIVHRLEQSYNAAPSQYPHVVLPPYARTPDVSEGLVDVSADPATGRGRHFIANLGKFEVFKSKKGAGASVLPFQRPAKKPEP
jgi:hypothetical protein